MSVPRHGRLELPGVDAAGRGSDYMTTFLGCSTEGYREAGLVPPVRIAATSWGAFRSAPVQVSRTPHDKTIHALPRQASEKRQGTKSRAGRGSVSPLQSMGI
jgi:hypothetical protein